MRLEHRAWRIYNRQTAAWASPAAPAGSHPFVGADNRRGEVNPVRAPMKDAMLQSTRWSTARLATRAMFLTRKFVIGYQVPGEPHLDPGAARHFRDVIADTSVYLEYGSGGSTLAAWQNARVVVTVDSDRRFLRSVQKQLARSSRSPAVSRLIHADIGITRRWGIPVLKSSTPQRLRRWRNYAEAPWPFLRERTLEPDTIFIDGRFRVACILECLCNLRARSPCRILVDDFLDRPHYDVLQPFVHVDATHGKMAALTMRADFDREHCRRALPGFYSDWR